MKIRFTATLEDGHKGAAVIVPFDPVERWKTPPVPIASAAYGKPMPGHPVRGTLAGHSFTGWIGKRWGRCFLLVDDTLRRATGVAPGDAVEVVVEPREPARPRAAR
jgi:hypothetical protein